MSLTYHQQSLLMAHWAMVMNSEVYCNSGSDLGWTGHVRSLGYVWQTGLKEEWTHRIGIPWTLSSQGYGFSCGHVWMWELDCEEGWVPKNWCFWTVVLAITFSNVQFFAFIIFSIWEPYFLPTSRLIVKCDEYISVPLTCSWNDFSLTILILSLSCP